MSNRQLEDAQQQKLREYVAQQLGISIEALDDHPYEIDEAGSGMAWRVTWEDTVPEGVEAHGAVSTQWTDIHPLYEPDDA